MHILGLIFILVGVCTFNVEGGWFRRIVRTIGSGSDRNCFCKAYDADTNELLHDFGSIQRCHGWPGCSCGRIEMISCGDKCDQRVEGWISSGPAKCRGRYVKKHYKASTCSEGFGHERRLC